MHCIICKSTDLKGIKIKKINRNGYYCLKCSSEFLWPQPTKKDIERIYDKSYYKSWGISTEEEKPEVTKLKKGTFARYLKKVQFYKKNGKLLDIGSAFGYLMEVAEESGFDVYGVELSHFSSSTSKKKFGSKVTYGHLSEAHFPDNNFDIVTMFDLIEHIPDPVAFMKEIRRVIKKGGFVAITTPDTKSFSYKLLGYRNWFHWKLEHLVYFNKKSMTKLLQNVGFSIIEKKRAYKMMSFQYLQDQFMAFPHPIFSPLFNFISRIIPKSIKNKNFFISGGEMFLILKAD